MKPRISSTIALVVCAIFFSIAYIAFFGTASLRFPLISGIIFLFLATPRTAFVWTLTVGLVFEVVSPFPAFSYAFALLATMLALRICMKYYISHRTIISALVAGLLGSLLFELSLHGFVRLGRFFSSGWIPAFDFEFARYLLWQMVVTAISLGLIIAIAQRFSPRVRGVVIGAGTRTLP